MVSSCSSPDSGPSYGILNLANVADTSLRILHKVMHFKIFTKAKNLLHPLHLLIESRSVFYPVRPFSRDVDVQLSH